MIVIESGVLPDPAVLDPVIVYFVPATTSFGVPVISQVFDRTIPLGRAGVAEHWVIRPWDTTGERGVIALPLVQTTALWG